MRTKVMWLFIVVLIFTLSGCAGKIDYARPTSTPVLKNSVVVEKSKDEVWKIIIPALAKHFYVINNMDKESGIINISYAGDPEKYVDCGRITSYVKNVRGERTYDFPAAKAYQQYEIMTQGTLLNVRRTMNLEGRMNIVVEVIGPKKTKVTANTRYILSRKAEIGDVRGRQMTDTESISFNTGEEAGFSPKGKSGERITCHCTGEFEKDVLSVLLNLK